MVDKVINSDLKKDTTSTSNEVESAALLNNMPLEINFVRHKLEQFQTNVVRDVEKHMSCMIDDVMQEMRQHQLQSEEFRSFAQKHHQQRSTWHNRLPKHDDNQREAASTNSDDNVAYDKVQQAAAKTTDKCLQHQLNQQKKQRRTLPDKSFVTRESYLTALLEVDHMKTIYHIFYIILLVFLMNSVCYDYFVEGRVNFGLGTFKSGLNKIHYVLGIWLLQHVFIFALYYAFLGWSTAHAKLAKQPSLQKFCSHSCLITYIGSQLVFVFVASTLCLKLDLPFVTASVLMLETIRLLMKMHAFVRTNVPRVLAGKLKSADDAAARQAPAKVPPFSCYLYFLFAPTLIYRDNYPRTSQIRWRFATARFLEVVAIAFLYSYIHERHIKVHFQHYGREEMDASALILKLFGMLMPSVIIFLCGFYLILHSWLNFTAELLRFGDRMFYKDWWTASSYEGYYRNWNVVVHDWLYEFIYKDFYTHVFKGNKVASSMMVFMVSALVHEQVLGLALQLFFPVMFVFFGVVGVGLIFVTRNLPKNFGNFMLWLSLIHGNALMVSLYSAEYYAQINCGKGYSTWAEYLTPAVWSCYMS